MSRIIGEIGRRHRRCPDCRGRSRAGGGAGRPAKHIGIVAVAVLLILTGCVRKASDVTGGPVSPEQQATVLIGVAITEYERSPFGGTANSDVTLRWQEYDRASEKLIFPKGRMFWIQRSCSGPPGGSCDLRAMGHKMLMIPAGDYVLKSLTISNRATSFLPLWKDLWGNGHVPFVGEIKGSSAPRYHFEPGEVAYLGDFTFDIRKFPAELVSAKRDDAAAQAALTDPDARGRFAFRAPEGAAVPAPDGDLGLRLDSTAVGRN
jgi:hypothetical protein